MRIRRCGETALLIETENVLGWYAALTARPLPGVVDLVPAAETLLVQYESDFKTLVSRLSEVTPAALTEFHADPVTIPVRYDGADLADVAKATGLSEDEVVTVHTGPEYTVAFTGFAPGFGYLTGLDERLRLPRRDTPRTRVPAGAVAVAGEYTGVYPRPSPGGWHLLGSTTAPLWDPTREQPALLRPGTTVRFEAVASLPPVPSREEPSATGDGGIEVVHCGPLGTVQDTGRSGYASLGVGRSGAADAAAAALANRLLGNLPPAACLELSFGATLRFRQPARVVVTGATCALTRDGRGEAMNAPFAVHAGETLVVGPAVAGLRSYVAVRGGLDVPVTLGSRSTDVLSGLGPDPLAPGVVLPIGDAYEVPPPAVEVAPVRAPSTDDLVVHVLPGPRDDWFTEDAMTTFLSHRYEVTAESNRVGVRLSGPALRRSRDGELPTEGMVAGSVQVPPNGAPIVFLADHPVTGGYPVIAVVRAADLPLIAQARPGQAVRFTRSGTPRRSAARSHPGT
ncbi:5-oxoprolinase subunit PxpB [Actinophytocola sp.]|uniref:5-oxoprolinase subunit PxpB n=1 Tax=Actinophytocola sp. TaxID=1872138 RepID=UPI002ED491EA